MLLISLVCVVLSMPACIDRETTIDTDEKVLEADGSVAHIRTLIQGSTINGNGKCIIGRNIINGKGVGSPSSHDVIPGSSQAHDKTNRDNFKRDHKRKNLQGQMDDANRVNPSIHSSINIDGGSTTLRVSVKGQTFENKEDVIIGSIVTNNGSRKN